MTLKIDGDEVKSNKALVVSLNGIFKIIDEKLEKKSVRVQFN